MTEAPKAKIYTRTGDKGQTHLVDGTRVAKSNLRVEAYGTVDELNASIGLARAEFTSSLSARQTSMFPDAAPVDFSTLDSTLEKVQSELFNAGSLLATEKEDILKTLPAITAAHVTHLENQIDSMTADLPVLKNFILPAGTKACAYLHLARTICRRAERHVSLLAENSSHYDLCLVYLNRLSDYLFVASRWANYQAGFPEVLWKKTT